MPHRASKKKDKVTILREEHPRAGMGHFYYSCLIGVDPEGIWHLDCEAMRSYYESGSGRSKVIIAIDISEEDSTLLNQHTDHIKDPSDPESVFDYVREILSQEYQASVTKESIGWIVIQQPEN